MRVVNGLSGDQEEGIFDGNIVSCGVCFLYERMFLLEI